MKRIEAQARWKNNPVTLSSWSYMRPTFHLDSPRTSERDRDRDREIKRGKGEEEGESLCLCTPHSAPALYFCFLFLCTLNAHTHSAMDFQLGPHRLCAWWNKHWQPLYICKGPCSSCACPTHTMRAHKHALTHTQPLNRRPSPSWGLQEEPTLHKMALAALSCTLPCSPAILAYTHSQTHTHVHSMCHVSLDTTTLLHISACYLHHYIAPTLNHWLKKKPTNEDPTKTTFK